MFAELLVTQCLALVGMPAIAIALLRASFGGLAASCAKALDAVAHAIAKPIAVIALGDIFNLHSS
jgi:hypothetical protein